MYVLKGFFKGKAAVMQADIIVLSKVRDAKWKYVTEGVARGGAPNFLASAIQRCFTMLVNDGLGIWEDPTARSKTFVKYIPTTGEMFLAISNVLVNYEIAMDEFYTPARLSAIQAHIASLRGGDGQQQHTPSAAADDAAAAHSGGSIDSDRLLEDGGGGMADMHQTAGSLETAAVSQQQTTADGSEEDVLPIGKRCRHSYS